MWGTQREMIDRELLEMLACPVCVGDLRYEPANERLVCTACRLAFPIREEIPVLLREDAVPLEAGSPDSEQAP